jgi:hypothetical protein
VVDSSSSSEGEVDHNVALLILVGLGERFGSSGSYDPHCWPISAFRLELGRARSRIAATTTRGPDASRPSSCGMLLVVDVDRIARSLTGNG